MSVYIHWIDILRIWEITSLEFDGYQLWTKEENVENKVDVNINKTVVTIFIDAVSESVQRLQRKFQTPQ